MPTRPLLTVFLCLCLLPVSPQAPPAALRLADIKLEAHLRGINPRLDQGILCTENSLLPELRQGGGKASLKAATVADQPFTQAWRVTIEKAAAYPGAAQLVLPLLGPFEPGALLWISFWLRSGIPGQKAILLPLVRGPAGPLPHALIPELVAERAWKEYHFAIPLVMHQLSTAPVELILGLGAREQALEVGGLSVYRFPRGINVGELPRSAVPLRYEGREPHAPWRETALERIERHRKALLEVTLLGADGKPVADAEVEVKQLRSAFAWGTAVSARWLLDATPDGARYRETLKRHYSRVSFENELEWLSWESASNRDVLERSLAWLQANGIEAHGSCLVRPSWEQVPASLRTLERDTEALRRAFRERIHDAVGSVKGRLSAWDVTCTPRDDEPPGLPDPGALGEWFRWVRAADPGSLLWLADQRQLARVFREDAPPSPLEVLVRRGRAEGAPMTGVNFQARFQAPLPPPTKAYELLERYAALGLKVQVTGFELATDDEEAQADYTRDLMTMVFSHPAATGFATAAFWEGAAASPEAAAWRADWAAKPSAKAWEELVTRKFRTELKGRTDSRGVFATRAFLGEHELTVSARGRTLRHRAKLEAAGLSLALPLL